MFFFKIILFSFFMVLSAQLVFAQTPDSDQDLQVDLTDRVLNPIFLRVAAQSAGGDNQFIIVGVDRSRSADQSGVVDLTKLGFHGQDINSVFPYYLLIKTSGGVKQVYSFEGNSVDKSITPKLPSPLLDIDAVRKRLLKAAPGPIIEGVQAVANITPGISLILDNIRRITGRPEHRRLQRGIYLMFLIETLLGQNTLSAFTGILSEEDLATLGAFLSIRYHTLGPAALLLKMSKEQLVHEFRYRIKLKLDYADGSLQKLVVRARQEGLRLVSLSPMSGELLYDCVNPTDLKTYNQFNLDVKKKELAKFIQTQCTPGVETIPIGIYSFTTQTKIIQLADFVDGNKARNAQFALFMHEIFADFEVFSPINTIVVSLGEGVLVIAINKSGSNHYLKERDTLYAEFAVMSDTGMLHMDDPGQARTPLLFALKNIKGISSAERARITGLLNSDDHEQFRLGFNDLCSLLARSSSGIRFLTGGDKERAQLEKSVPYNWSRFISWEDSPGRQALFTELARVEAIASDKGVERKQKALVLKRRKDEKEEVRQQANAQLVANAQETGSCTNSIQPGNNPVILFLVDGLRPDYLRQLAASDPEIIPTMKSLFIDHGLELQSFDSNSVTLPSWTTVLTGLEPDHTSIRGAGTATHDNGTPLQNLIDNRIDAHLLVIPKPTRGYNRLESLNVHWLPELVGRHETFNSYIPINDGTWLPIRGFASQFWEMPARYFYGTLTPSEQFDVGVGYEGARAIEKDPCRYKVTITWFGGVDEVMHTDDRQFKEAIRNVDRGMADIIKAANKDPVFKNAVVILTSDHGMAGGPEGPDPTRPFATNSKFIMKNSMFNLNQFFSGDEEGVSKKRYRFVVGSAKQPRELYDGGILMTFRRGEFTPYYFTNSGERIKNPGRPAYKKNRTLLVEPYGDAIAHVFVLKDPTKPTERTNYYDLTHFKTTDVTELTNMPEDLLSESHQRVNDLVANPNLRAVMDKYNGMRPVGIFAMPLQGVVARSSAERLAGLAHGTLTREPILVQSKGWDNGTQTTPIATRSALILIKDQDGEEFINYVVLSNFDQLADGTLIGTVQDSADGDPLGMKLVMAENRNQVWLTDRQWLEYTKNTWYPTALYAIPNLVTLSPDLLEAQKKNPAQLAVLKAEIPDFVLSANDGFTFNSFEYHQGDHGGLTRNQTRTSLFIHHPNMVNKPGLALPEVIMSRDVTPTVLDFLGLKEKAKGLQGRSFRDTVESAK